MLHEEGGTPQRSIDVLDRAASLLQKMPSAPAAETAQGIQSAGDVERALYYLERGGMTMERVEALELSARMNRSSSRLREARDLRQTLEYNLRSLA